MFGWVAVNDVGDEDIPLGDAGLLKALIEQASGTAGERYLRFHARLAAQALPDQRHRRVRP